MLEEPVPPWEYASIVAAREKRGRNTGPRKSRRIIRDFDRPPEASRADEAGFRCRIRRLAGASRPVPRGRATVAAL